MKCAGCTYVQCNVEVRAEKEVAVRPYVKSLIVASGKDIQYCIRRGLVLQ